MIHSTTGLIHTVAAIIALISGAVVFGLPKAGKRHKKIGFIYSGAMAVVIVTAFAIYRLTGGFNGLHIAAIVSTVTLLGGLLHVIRRKPEGVWFERHLNLMFWSYVGLVAAFIAEMATRVGIPMLNNAGVKSYGLFWSLIGLTTFTVIACSIYLLNRFYNALERYRPKAPIKIISENFEASNDEEH